MIIRRDNNLYVSLQTMCEAARIPVMTPEQASKHFGVGVALDMFPGEGAYVIQTDGVQWFIHNHPQVLLNLPHHDLRTIILYFIRE